MITITGILWQVKYIVASEQYNSSAYVCVLLILVECPDRLYNYVAACS